MKINKALVVLICILTLALIGLSSFTIYVFVNHLDNNNNNPNKPIETSKEKDKTQEIAKEDYSKSEDKNVKEKPTTKEPTKDKKLFICDICSAKTDKVFFVDDYTLCIFCDAHISDFLSPCLNCQKMIPNEDMYDSNFCKKCYEHNYDPPSQNTYICDSCNKTTDRLVNVGDSSFCPTCEEDYWNTFVVCSVCSSHIFECEITSGGMCINCFNKSNSNTDDSNGVEDNNTVEENQPENYDEIINE